MKTYTRSEPNFSLCGLNCCLCPRYHTSGPSRCPGCGGPDFLLLHPSCAVVNCNDRHDKVEYCFQCGEYPCEKYRAPAAADSFISYRNVGADMKAAAGDLGGYLRGLREKLGILERLLREFNDGKSKGFYCRAVNLLSLSELKNCMESAESDNEPQNPDIRQRAIHMRKALETRAEKLGITLGLRNKT